MTIRRGDEKSEQAGAAVCVVVRRVNQFDVDRSLIDALPQAVTPVLYAPPPSYAVASSSSSSAMSAPAVDNSDAIDETQRWTFDEKSQADAV
jgi:hypothetical protein